MNIYRFKKNELLYKLFELRTGEHQSEPYNHNIVINKITEHGYAKISDFELVFEI